MLKSALILIALFMSTFVFSQKAESNDDLKIFLDCNVSDNTYMRQNLGNVQFVRDQNLSDVHLFFLTQPNGSGGRLYDINFIGKNEFETINYKLSFSTDSNMTRDDERQPILEYIKLGLVRYWIAKGTLKDVSVTAPSPENETEEADEINPWDYWVFQISANSFF